MNRAVLKTKNNEFTVLLAISAEEQERGLMGAKWPPPAMAFVYQNPQFNSFWMKNTPSPLDIVFCLDGRITKICKGEPYSTSLIAGGLSDLVIEFPYGTCKDYGLVEGSEFNLSYSPKEENKISDNLLSVFSELLNSK
jgi:hypothetical protein